MSAREIRECERCGRRGSDVAALPEAAGIFIRDDSGRRTMLCCPRCAGVFGVRRERLDGGKARAAELVAALRPVLPAGVWPEQVANCYASVELEEVTPEGCVATLERQRQHFAMPLDAEKVAAAAAILYEVARRVCLPRATIDAQGEREKEADHEGPEDLR